MTRKLIIGCRSPVGVTPEEITYVAILTIDEGKQSDLKYLSDTVQDRIVKYGDAHVIVADVSSEWKRSMACTYSRLTP